MLEYRNFDDIGQRKTDSRNSLMFESRPSSLLDNTGAIVLAFFAARSCFPSRRTELFRWRRSGAVLARLARDNILYENVVLE